jgi:serine/threonine-protein kinase
MWLPDETIAHLRRIADEPDLSATKYRILGPLGQGGMATVYRVLDAELERELALKVVRAPELDPTFASRLAEEARILAGLEHPGIVPVHDVGTLPDGRVYYAMKLVRGKLLGQVAGETPELNERLRIFLRVCEAVAFAHAHGVLHRDIKPDNIMVGAFGEVLVMDWGVAKRARASPQPPVPITTAAAAAEEGTLHGTRMGTPGWMAPEQERGQTDRIDQRTDVFGLGAVLGYLLGLRGGTRPETAAPARLRAIVTRATQPEPQARYRSVDELGADVRRFLDGLPVSAYREPIHERAARLISKYRTPILLVLSYLIVRILLIAFAGD